MLFKLLLNTGLLNSYLKGAIERYLNETLGSGVFVIVNKVNAIEEEGRFRARIDANVDITKEAAKDMLGL